MLMPCNQWISKIFSVFRSSNKNKQKQQINENYCYLLYEILPHYDIIVYEMISTTIDPYNLGHIHTRLE